MGTLARGSNLKIHLLCSPSFTQQSCARKAPASLPCPHGAKPTWSSEHWDEGQEGLAQPFLTSSAGLGRGWCLLPSQSGPRRREPQGRNPTVGVMGCTSCTLRGNWDAQQVNAHQQEY